MRPCLALGLMVALGPLTGVRADEDADAVALAAIRQHLPPLRHSLGDRVPLLAWQGRGFPSAITEQGVDTHRLQLFLERGFIPLSNGCSSPEEAQRYAPLFRFWQRSGVPVCFLGQGWLQVPFVEDRRGRCKAAHQPPAEQSCEFPCPAALLDPVRRKREAARVRATVQALQEAGVHVGVVLIDFEAGAYLRNIGDREEHVARQAAVARQCPRCVAAFGAQALATPEAYAEVVNRARADAIRAMFVEPVRVVFPDARLGNYYAWPIDRGPHPEGRWPAYGYEDSGLDIAMPRVYMNAGWGGAGRDQEKMNWNAFYCCLEAFSPAAAVKRPQEWLIPWVHVWLGGRYVSFVMKGRRLPEPWALAETARHMMLRGAESFAVWMDAQMGDFPPGYPYPEYAAMGQFVYDLKGVQAGFDDMLAFNDFLRQAKPMTFEVPGQRAVLGDSTATWSGMTTRDRALVRTVSFGCERALERAIPAFGRQVKLAFPERGRFYWVYGDGRAEPVSPPASQ